MSVHVRHTGGVFIVHPRFARLTAVNGVHELRAALGKGIRDGYEGIAIDFAGVNFADNAALGVLADAYKTHAKADGLLCLFNCSADLAEFFDQTLLDRLIPVVEDEDAALAILAGRRRRERKVTAAGKALEKAYGVAHRLGALPDRRSAMVHLTAEHERRRGVKVPTEVDMPEAVPAPQARPVAPAPPMAPVMPMAPAPEVETRRDAVETVRDQTPTGAPPAEAPKKRRTRKPKKAAEDPVLPLQVEEEPGKTVAEEKKKPARKTARKPASRRKKPGAEGLPPG